MPAQSIIIDIGPNLQAVFSGTAILLVVGAIAWSIFRRD